MLNTINIEIMKFKYKILNLTFLIGLFCSCSHEHNGPIHVDPEAIAVNAIDINEDEATVSVDFDVINATGETKSINAEVEILLGHKTIDTQAQDFEAADTTALSFSFDIPNPDLTTWNDSTTYQARIKLKSGWKVLDEYDKDFELRANEFISCLPKKSWLGRAKEM